MGYTNSGLVSYTKLSPNHSGQRTHSIDRITPHCVVGQLSAETICDCFISTDRQASCNYGIGTDGRVSLCVEEKNRSWCSSSNANDQRAITIECACDMTDPYTMNDAVYATLIKLCTDICQRNGKSKLLWFADKDKTLNYNPASDEMVITVHRWFANKACPGDWLYNRLSDLAAKVTANLGGTSSAAGTSTTASTATVTSFPATPFSVEVIIDDLNYRSAPSMNGTVNGQTGKGVFTITEVLDGWGKLKSGAGWIYLENPSYCTVLGSTGGSPETSSAVSESNSLFPTTPFTVQVIIDDLNYRSEPSMNGNVNGQTGKGVFTITEVSDGWGKLKSGAGWIYLENPSYCTVLGSTSSGRSASSSTGVSATATTAATTTSDEETIWNTLFAFIGNAFGVAGLMGNLYAECGLKSNNLQNNGNTKLGMTDAEFTAAFDNGSYAVDTFIHDGYGYGLAQWTYYTRKQNLVNYAKAAGKSIGDLAMQLGFLCQELTGYTSVLSTLKSATSVKEASDVVLTQFERPADQSDAVKTKRASYGQTYYDKYAEKATTAQATTEQTGTEATSSATSAAKVIAVAAAEIGYNEKASNASLDDKTANTGDANYTKYARDFDEKYPNWYNGKKNGYAWCDMFVDWCFLTAFGYETALKLLCQPEKSAGAGCTYSMGYYKNKGQFHVSDPKSGDQIFFGDSASSSSHTGLVEKADSSKVYTIEGNSSDQVIRRTYDLSNSRILGYGRPAYDSVDATTETSTDAASQASSDSHFKVKVSIDDLNIRTGPGTNYATIGQYTGKGVFTIVEVQSGQGSTAGWGRLKSGAGWVSLDYTVRI